MEHRMKLRNKPFEQKKNNKKQSKCVYMMKKENK